MSDLDGPLFCCYFVMACDACITYSFVKPFLCDVIKILISLKHIDVKWL